MKKKLVILLTATFLISMVGCNKTPPEVPSNADKDKVNSSVEELLLNRDSYDKFDDEIYLCDDVYRSDDTPTHGTGSIALPMAQDTLEVADFKILLCGDGCPPEDVVSRASQGYAPAYHVVPDGEIDGNFKVSKFKMEIPEPMLEDIKNQGVYEQITEQIESQYYYLLVLDKKHYAYIHLERIEGAQKLENEAELADFIVKNAVISFEPKKEKLDLTVERIVRLAENKRERLTWDDFEMYNAIETGSGLYILFYEIDETFDLMIGGDSPASSPMYIRLVTKADRSNYIDIRTEDIEKFISENIEEKYESEDHVTVYSKVTEISQLPDVEENAIVTGAVVGGVTKFYCFTPGLKYYRYDLGTRKYYECELYLRDGYKDGEIIHIRAGAGSGEVEIFIKATDKNGNTVYPAYNFGAPVDPLNSQPSSIVIHNEQEMIKYGINTEILCGYPTALYFKTKNYLEEEFHRVFDPYYDIQSLTIDNWHEDGNQATFTYKMTHRYYNTDPDTVDYIKKAKENSSKHYEKLYNDYLSEKEANFEFKVILNGETPVLYSNVSPIGVEWETVKIDDYVLPHNHNIDATEDLPNTPITLKEINKNEIDEIKHHLYIQDETEYTRYFLFQPTKPLADVKLSLMDFADDGFIPVEKLYSLNELRAEKPLVIGIVFYGDFTTFELSFDDETNNTYHYIIYASGKDGSVILEKTE